MTFRLRARCDAALRLLAAEDASGWTPGRSYTVEAVLEADSLEPFAGSTPSAERQAEHFFVSLSEAIRARFGGRVRLARIRVTQEPEAWVEYERG